MIRREFFARTKTIHMTNRFPLIHGVFVMRFRHAFAALLTFAAVFVVSSAATAQVHPHHAADRKAAKEVKPQVAPKKARAVLIWNTPAHLMDKDHRKGLLYPLRRRSRCGPSAEESGAFKPVVSDDLAVFAPENLKTIRRDRAEQRGRGHGLPRPMPIWRRNRLGKLARMPSRSKWFSARASLIFWKTAAALSASIMPSPPTASGPSSKILGGTFTGHPWTEEVGVTVEEPGNPLVAAAFGGKDFHIADEIYEYGLPRSPR